MDNSTSWERTCERSNAVECRLGRDPIAPDGVVADQIGQNAKTLTVACEMRAEVECAL